MYKSPICISIEEYWRNILNSYENIPLNHFSSQQQWKSTIKTHNIRKFIKSLMNKDEKKTMWAFNQTCELHVWKWKRATWKFKKMGKLNLKCTK
jgi:hypothetical protein